jgi:hypothetical protein
MGQKPIIRFPVICPICFQESIASHELAPIAAAILRGSPISLETDCHKATWTAGCTEREQIRQYLAAGVWVNQSVSSESATS